MKATGRTTALTSPSTTPAPISVPTLSTDTVMLHQIAFSTSEGPSRELISVQYSTDGATYTTAGTLKDSNVKPMLFTGLVSGYVVGSGGGTFAKDLVLMGVDAVWASLHTPAAIALMEVTIAARSRVRWSTGPSRSPMAPRRRCGPLGLQNVSRPSNGRCSKSDRRS